MSVRRSRDPAARRRRLLLCGLAAAAALAGAVVGSRRGDGGEKRSESRFSRRGDGGEKRSESRSSRAAVPADDPGRADSPAARLPLEQQVGQLLLMSFDGAEAPAYILRRLRRGEGAGVILFAKNAPDAGSLRALTASLQRAARGEALVATDQEGGPIRSVGFAPPESSQTALASPTAARDSASAAARSLREGGVNVNLAPVADVAAEDSVMTGRAYPGDSEAVSRLVGVAVQAHARQRVAATVKHFPGLGRARENTDDAPVTVAAPRTALERFDLSPFRAAERAGVPLVMSSHALYPALDRTRIASQSPLVIGRVLRRELGFRGAVVTDSIEAEAVLARSTVSIAAERAVAAGTDLVLMTGSGSWNLIYPRLLRRARTSAVVRGRVRAAAGRVLALKRRLGLRAGPEP